MKKYIVLLLATLTLVLLASPAQANVWRSSSGNIFRFQENGNMTILRVDGSSGGGRWWWTRYGYEGAYQLYGDPTLYRVFINPYAQTAEVHSPGRVTYWSYLGSRGAADADETSEAGWMMAVPATLRPMK